MTFPVARDPLLVIVSSLNLLSIIKAYQISIFRGWNAPSNVWISQSRNIVHVLMLQSSLKSVIRFQQCFIYVSSGPIHRRKTSKKCRYICPSKIESKFIQSHTGKKIGMSCLSSYLSAIYITTCIFLCINDDSDGHHWSCASMMTVMGRRNLLTPRRCTL